MADLTEKLAILSVQGPNSHAILRKLTSDSLDDASFPLYSHKVITVAGHRLRAIRISFVGELGECFLKERVITIMMFPL